ncbi:MAG: tetratricopeptide repeat protein [Planctomycetota bacterium]
MISGCEPDPKKMVRESADEAGVTTFSSHVAALVFKNCSYCHRPGEAAPFSLLTYDDARRRAGQIAEVTRQRFMPPWLPAHEDPNFAGARRLTEREIEIFAEWAAAGAPLGDESKLPTPPVFTEGWQLGTPDLVLESPPYQLTAAGGDQFRNFVVPIVLDSPRWVQSIELRPDNPRVTHHARLGIDSSYEAVRRDAVDPEPGYDGMAWGQDPNGQLVIWAPGMVAHRGAAGTAWRLHPNMSLVLHTHLQGSGKPELVRFRIGVHFAAAPPDVQPVILRIGSRDIDIPPNQTDHVVSDTFEVPVELDVHAVFPHAHSLCKRVSVHAELPNGTQRTIIKIAKFDENWHDNYRYVAPVRLPVGTKLVSQFSYDNSAANVRNRHDPPQRVVYGSNASDEMADIYLQVTTANPEQRALLLAEYDRYERASKLIGFRKTLEAYPADFWSLEGMAVCYLGLDQPAAAIEALEQRLKLGGELEVHSVSLLGMACLAGGDLARAEQLLRQSLAMAPDYPLAWLGLGKTLKAANDLEGAERAFGRASELAPELTDAQLHLAELLMARGQLEAAASACEAALRVAPNLPNVLMRLAEIRTKQRRYDESLRLLVIAHELAPYTHPAKVLLAVYCSQSGETERAKQLLREARTEAPNHPVPALLLGQIAVQERRIDDARQLFESAATMRLPDNWPVSHRQRFGVLLHSERYKLAREIGDLDLARASLREWIRYDPKSLELQRLIMDNAPLEQRP